MDAVTAFLQGDLTDEIYMIQPDEFTDGTDKVCKLNKAVYGLKQASREWNKALNLVLLNFGLKRSKLDPCIYYKIFNNIIIIIAVYVDDILILSNNNELRGKLKATLCNSFKMKDLGEATNCVGIQISRDRVNGKIFLDQQKYIIEILDRFNMTDCNIASTPADLNQKLSLEMCPKTKEELAEMEKIPYQQAVGSILYLAQSTRPDLVYAINNVSRFNNNFGKAHWVAVKRILRYLKGSMNLKLVFCKETYNNVIGFSDADWAGEIDQRRSCTGYVYVYQGGAISWNSKMQHTVALSSTEAEYMALSSATQEALWLKQLQAELEPSNVINPVLIYTDNRSALHLATNDAYHGRSKHIDVRTEEMVADSLTKAVTTNTNQFCIKGMGLY